MVDFHTHMLPEFDDGSNSIETTVAMLGMFREQKIKTVVATPHFIPSTENAYEFFNRRQQALERVTPYLDGITVVPAAEVQYCRNISKIDGLEMLAIGKTGYLLLEMPYHEWTKQTADDVIAIMDNTGLVPILAHIDRYWNRKTREFFERFLEAGVLMQLNVSAFDSFWGKRRFVKLISEGKIHLLGSDCHNMTKRPPNLNAGFKVLEKYGLTSLIEKNEENVLTSKIQTFAHRIIK